MPSLLPPCVVTQADRDRALEQIVGSSTGAIRKRALLAQRFARERQMVAQGLLLDRAVALLRSRPSATDFGGLEWSQSVADLIREMEAI